MHQGRRTSGRRRRVLYSSHHADSSPSTAASRREAAKLREARRPPAAYGTKVNRRLRGRWFSLVPVRRRSLIIGSTVIASLTWLLVLAHYFAVTRAWLVYQPEIARPLRLDRPDSFGHWIMCVLLAGASGVSLLIYQLRRYRNDDYRGQYRLWRLVLILLMIASIHSLVDLISWGGGLLDAAFGKRVALTGSDWLRLLVTVGGTIVALRLVAEVHRSRWALLLILTAGGFRAIPELANWNVIAVESLGRWTLVTSAPLLGCTALFLGLVGYLRMLFREVRQIEDEPLAVKFQQFREKIFRSNDREETELDEEEEAEPDASEPRRRWWSRRRKDRSASERESAEEFEDEDEYEEESDDDEYEDDVADEDQPVDEEDLSPRKKRRWFGLRAAKAEPTDEEEVEEPTDEAAEPAKKRRRWSLRLDPRADRQQEDDDPSEPLNESEQQDEKPKKRFGLSWRRRAKNASDESPEADTAEQQTDDPPERDVQANDEEFIDPNEIDWNAMSKQERRRLRKKLKRQQRAA
jgi:hypothetical protein